MLRKTALLLLFALLHPPDVSAQDLRNRTEEMYRLGRVIIAREPLPDKIYEAQRYKFIIRVIFFEKGTDKIITSGVGTGFTSDRPGVILTARHLLTETVREMDVLKAEKIKINPRFDYTYMFMGTIITPTQWMNFPLSLAAMGETGTTKDMMALRPDVQTMEQARILGDIMNPNPLNMLMRTFEFADANVGDKVYISGYAPAIWDLQNKNSNTVTPIYVDLINFTFLAEVTKEIKDMPGNRNGVDTMYQILDGAEPGYSGGRVMNVKGQTIAMTIAMSKNFVYAISSKDLKDFLDNNRLR